ncbi:DUF4269 domain-containing protein [Flavobacterium lipolyticum]|uniref:DUF4269 domain-containing protein n=1 Tax=Flavobacterium lipolyticum TaxID=2893754 RepID=A0ABS8M1G7_9FLAO|nr:DUF4269 domain-containing protein [Flavobacterium sp. F-126]MCC9018685.1 DUF4269 domain-containing protein [Flavobacterium sp. F-126]
MIDFTTIDYLKNGNSKQILAYKTLTQHNILGDLVEFDPILVGTIPIAIDIESSDLDIICYWKNKTKFIEKLHAAFGNKNNYTIRETVIDNRESIIASFRIGPFEFEIFGQNIPTQQQNAHLHMLIEHEILQLKGENFRLEIIKLKQKGYKTEPAFAFLLGLNGDPYAELLKYKI